ncbi:putative short-chain dehydrogenase [Biscogniauxia sp. FL1348]|nr:putative short-chain dehydrogenase [Biscogniauxia sp. FL1348]
MGAHFSSMVSQAFPPKPAFTERDLPSLEGKVYIVTGANTGVGKELARLLYSKDATVYIVARSEGKSNKAIEDIKESYPTSKGALKFLFLDLNDLSTIKPAVERFLSIESKLHVLFNNAGVQTATPDIPKTVQGYEHHLGINCLGTFALTKLLTPILISTAQAEKPSSGLVRVIWVSSSGTEITGEKSVGIQIDNLDYHIEKPYLYKYGVSKTGNWMHGVEYAERHRADGIISIPLNPGNLASDLYRDAGLALRLICKLITYPSVNGAYTELFAGLSPDITLEKTGSWVVPFGRIMPIRKDLLDATKSEDEGGNGTARKFWDWTEDQVKPFI